MHRKVLAALFALALLGAAPVAFAETYVEFNDGRYLKVRSHQVRESWIRLELQPGASMVIPAGNVQIIERDRLIVWYQQASDTAIAALARSMRAAEANKTVAMQWGVDTPGHAASDDPGGPTPVGD